MAMSSGWWDAGRAQHLTTVGIKPVLDDEMEP